MILKMIGCKTVKCGTGLSLPQNGGDLQIIDIGSQYIDCGTAVKVRDTPPTSAEPPKTATTKVATVAGAFVGGMYGLRD